MNHDPEQRLSLCLGEVVSENSQPCLLGSLFVRVDRLELFGDGLAGDEEGFEFVVVGGDVFASGENGDEAIKSFVTSSYIGVFTAWSLA